MIYKNKSEKRADMSIRDFKSYEILTLFFYKEKKNGKGYGR